MTTRRNFLHAGLGAALLPLLSAGSRAQSKPRKLIIALAYGGWDPMWVFDPKPDHVEIDRIPGKIRNFGELPIWVHQTRNSVTKFFENWGSMATVINGIAVESLAHESCIDVMLTGALGEGRPDLAARLAKAHGLSLPLPYFSLSPQMENRGLQAHTGMLGDSNQLMSLVNPNFNFPEPGKAAPDPGLSLSVEEHSAIFDYLQQAQERCSQKAEPGTVASSQLADYQSSMSHAIKLMERAQGPGFLSNETLFSEINAGWRHVPAAFKDDLSLSAMIQPQMYWDTHAYNSEQGKAFEDFFAGLNLMMGELHSGNMLEQTDVLVLSEMGRTPMHNKDDGKDHWPWTSAMLLSTQVSGQRVMGKSDELLRPKPLNLHTGVTDPKGTLLHAEHILAAVAKLHGIQNKSWYSREAFHALLG